MKKIYILAISIITLVVGTTTFGATVFNSNQVGSSPQNGYYLKTNGTVSTWAAVTATGGGSGTVSTSTSETSGYLPYWTSTNATPALLGKVATNTASCSGTTSCTPFTILGNSSVTISSAGVASGLGTSSPLTAGLLLQSTAWNAVANIATSALNLDLSNTLGTLPVNRGGTGLTSGYNNSNWDTAFGWGNHTTQGYEFQSYASSSLAAINHLHTGVYDVYGQATSSLNSFIIPYYATTTHPFISSLPSLLITKSQVSDLGTLFTQALASTTFQARNDWTTHDSYPAACTNQFIRTIGDTNTCASVATTDFATANISQWTNDSLYITQAIASTTFADKNLYVSNANYYATTTHKNISSLPSLVITKSQVSDFGTYLSTIGSGSIGNLAYWNGTNSLTGAATTTLTENSLALSLSQPISVIGGSASVLSLATSSLFSYPWTVANGGTGSTSLSGILKGSGASISTAVAADFPTLNQNTTGTAVATSDSTWTLHNSYPSACTPGQVVSGVGDTLTCVATSTNANTATALATDPTTCNPGQVVSDIAANGTLTCVATSTNANTATALEANPTDCGGGQYANAIDASGNLTCGTPAGGATAYLGQIGDVSTTTLLNGYVLKYNTGTSKWESVATSSLGISGSGNGTFTYYPAFSYATSTAWSGTTTLALGPAYINETWNGIQCFTDTGTVFVQITDGTNVMNSLQASTTVGTVTLSSNNSFSAGEKRYANIGTPASTPTKISCSASRTYTGGGGNGVNPGLVGEFAYYDTTNSVSGTSTLSLNTTTGKISIPSLATPAGTFLALDASGQIISTSTPTGSMTYPGAGIALSTGSAWDTPITNNSANWNTAYGWGNHATAGYELQAYASSTLVSRTDWTTHDSYPAACTNQFIRTIGDTNTCATVGAADVSLANLSATDTTLTFSGTYNGATARTIGLNLSNANTWTGLQTFANASTTNLSSSNASSTLLYMGTGYIPGLGTAAGSFLAVNASGQIIATTTPSGGGYSSLSDLQAAVSNDFHNLGGTDATGGGSSDEKWATSTDTTSIYPAGGTKVGIGTTTPQWPLQISSSNSPQLSLGDGINPQWTFRNAGGNLYIGTSSPDTFATSSINALTINNNGQVLHQVGTVTLPSISFIGDSDTGIYHSAANTVNMGTNGVSRVTVNSNGLSATAIDVTTEQYKWHGSYILGAEDTNNLYVGIGATPPYGSGTGVNNTFVGYMAGGAGEDSISNTYLGASAGWGNVGDYNIGIGDDALGNTTFSNNNIAIGTTVMVGSGSGQNINKNVGIGDLALNNTSFSGDQNIVIGYSAAQSLTTGSNNIIIGVASTTANDNLTTGSGNIKIGHNISFPDATGDYQLNIGNIIYGTNINGTGSTLSTGKIGIGTTTPDYLLTVYGTSSTTLAYINTLNIPTLATPAGAFLAVNASGQIIATTTPSGGTYTAGDFLTLTGSDFDVDTGAIADGATTILATADAIYDFMRTSTSTLSSYYLPITGGTGTGTYDFGGATALEIPNGTAPVFSAVGQIGFDTTDNQFLIGTSTSNDPAVIPTRIKLFGGGLASTSVDFVSGGVIPTSQQIDGFIIDYISCQVDSGTSVTINFSNVAGTSDSNSVVCDVGGQTDLVTANRTYTAGSFNRIEISGVSGAVDYLTYSVWGYITRE